ncbi:MAG: hypothetical protein KDD45_08725, partial [Bdellovibrionales bacterium]|nr:hypothetical protein [Bdellovibrionales bacterium]
MKINIITVLTLLSFSTLSFAARVAVTDSGTDFSHEWLKGRALVNTNEKAGNMVDDDQNGKVDDIVGWNFIDDYGRVFFPEHEYVADESLFKIFEVISRIQAGSQTPEDEKFWKENITNLDPAKKEALVAKLNFYGEYAHSTHCSGIIASLSPESKIMSNRV